MLGARGGMPVEPGDVWRSLPPTLRRQVSEDLAVVLREMIDGLGTRQTESFPEAGGDLRSAVHPHQVLTNQESLRLQYALQHRAREFGWHEADIDVIDSDLGMSGAAVDHRQGFKDLVARVTLGEVGIILSIEVTRLARNCSDWYPLLDVCGHRQCLIADRDGVYDPGTPNGRLLLGLKGTISELELHTIAAG